MARFTRMPAAFGLLFLSVTLSPEPAEGGESVGPGSLQIALPRTLFRDIPDAALKLAGNTYQSLMYSQVGMAGHVVHLPDASSVAASLDKGQIDLGVFQGFEFAWVRAKYPNLEPLVVAVPQHRTIQACLIAKADSPVNTMGDLKGGKLAVPLGSRDHIYLFVDKLQVAEGAGSAGYSLVKPSNADDALEDVVDGVYDATMVDVAAFNSFKANKPGRARRLKIVCSSECFPPGVIAYKKGGVDPATLQKCRDGLIGAQTNARAGVLLRMMRLKGFEQVPANYDDLLKKSAEAYPTPPVVRASLER